MERYYKGKKLEIKKLTATETTIQWLIMELIDKGETEHRIKQSLESLYWDKHPQERKRQRELINKIFLFINSNEYNW